MTIDSFLRYYEQAHRNNANRYVHHVAHTVAFVGLVMLWRPLVALPLIASGFLISWAGHYAFERNTPAFFDASATGGFGASVVKKLQVAFGGLLWSWACFLRLFGVGPLV
jgi:hypothetical protein